MCSFHLLIAVLLGFAAWLSVAGKKLTGAGALAGGITAFIIYLGAGLTGLAMLGAFFLMAVGATGWRRQQKERLGAAERAQGQRTALQVLANGCVAAVTSALAWLLPAHGELFVLMAAGLAAASADTLSSELGMIYGRRFYDIISLRSGNCGADGVVSIEGTLIGIAASAAIAGIHAAGTGQFQWILVIIIAGTIGNLADSLLGATLERRGLIGNNGVNLINTLGGALTACASYFL